MKTLRNIINWNRVSTLSQRENYSLEMQEEKCKEYIKNAYNSRVLKANIFNIVGSGYNVSSRTMQSYKDLMETENPIIVCLTVDRFSRNEKTGLSIYKEIKELNGKFIFVLDRLDTSRKEDEELFFKKLQEAEAESVLKSQKMKATNEFLLRQKIQNSFESLFYISKFISSMINGDKIEEIFKDFRKVVNWNTIPGLRDTHYQIPIQFDEEILSEDGLSIKKGTVTFETVSTILNDYLVKIPINDIKNKKWSESLCKAIYNYTDDKTNFLDILVL